MRSTRNRFGLAMVLAMAAAAVIAVPASAHPSPDDVAGTCALEGTAETNPPVQLSGGSGTYEFNELVFACAGTVDGVATTATFGIESEGDYVNEVCGTGTAEDTDAEGTVLTETLSSGHTGWKTPAIGYEIEFLAGAGTLTFTSGASGSGVIDIVATGPTGGPNECTESFAVVGEVDLETTISTP